MGKLRIGRILEKTFKGIVHIIIPHHHHHHNNDTPAPLQVDRTPQIATINQLKADNQQSDAKNQTLQLNIDNNNTKIEELKKQFEEEKITQENMGMIDNKNYQQAAQLYRSINPRANTPQYTIGIMGLSGRGKSKIINRLSKNDELVRVGRNQTTLDICIHHYSGNDYCDIPGKNDRISYLTEEYFALIKSLGWLALVIENSIDEISLFAQLLDEVGKKYIIIINKMDNRLNDMEEFKQGIINGIKSLSLNININNDVFFISADYPTMENTDWIKLTQRLHDDIPTYQYSY